MPTIYDFTLTEMDGSPISLFDYKNKVLLIVNTASKCGLAPQLSDLQALYQTYHEQGLVIIGCASNQFHQELTNSAEIKNYCQLHFGVTFPITKPLLVNGENADPLFTYLKTQSQTGPIKWNYTKFLIARDGTILHRYAPITKPTKMEKLIIAALSET